MTSDFPMFTLEAKSNGAIPSNVNQNYFQPWILFKTKHSVKSQETINNFYLIFWDIFLPFAIF